jgi:hypothetical protein
VIYIFNFSILEQTLEKENDCILSLKLCFQSLRENLTSKMSVESINTLLLEIEKKARVFQEIEQLRYDLVKEFCSDNDIENNLESVINFFAKNNQNIALSLSQMVTNLKDLVYEVNLLNELIAFQSTLNDFIYKILSGNPVSHQKTYDKTGKDLDFNLPSKEWRG